MKTKRKAYAYITRNNRELLVFTQPAEPESGVQIPGGTVSHGETFEEAVLREATEETGIEGLQIVEFLGDHMRESRGEWQHRYFYHMTTDNPLPDTWSHGELSFDHLLDKTSRAFDFYWIDMKGEIPDMRADRGIFIPLLQALLGL